MKMRMAVILIACILGLFSIWSILRYTSDEDDKFWNHPIRLLPHGRYQFHDEVQSVSRIGHLANNLYKDQGTSIPITIDLSLVSDMNVTELRNGIIDEFCSVGFYRFFLLIKDDPSGYLYISPSSIPSCTGVLKVFNGHVEFSRDGLAITERPNQLEEISSVIMDLECIHIEIFEASNIFVKDLHRILLAARDTDVYITVISDGSGR